MSTSAPRTHTLSVLVEDKPGVLARVASLFSRRGYNMQSLAVGATEHKNLSRMTIVVDVEDSPLAELADIVLPLQGAETSFIYKPTAARYGMLLAIDVLATELALANPEDNQERLRRIKLALDEYRGGDDHLPLGD